MNNFQVHFDTLVLPKRSLKVNRRLTFCTLFSEHPATKQLQRHKTQNVRYALLSFSLGQCTSEVNKSQMLGQLGIKILYGGG